MSDYNKNIVEDPLAVYSTHFYDVGQQMILLFGGIGALKLQSNVVSDFDLLELTRRGIPKKAILGLIKKISLTIQELAGVMHINERTFQRFNDTDFVKSEYSEKAIELARLYARGEEVFGSLDKFKLWMKTPSIVFKNNTPFALLDSSIGFGLVFTELGRIEHGIFS
ncbi:type II RES/Xre toxin-antitoxin system antitoxin [Pedobacter arcticus]|uniref:type II RES/Xre toxin-antitoxin system antitoxin n=1 Tax=Pedobacter arcticus TaxID=752140 RepID=UPI0002E0DEEC|nr:antitoxin Xre/MbcA/ParS toxin-binding domain-containing protein [Pedobacter arcticus]